MNVGLQQQRQIDKNNLVSVPYKAKTTQTEPFTAQNTKIQQPQLYREMQPWVLNKYLENKYQTLECCT